METRKAPALFAVVDDGACRNRTVTRVINLKDRTGSPDEVYIGRPGHGFDGYFGSPIVRGKVCPVCRDIHFGAGATLPCYRKWLWEKIGNDKVYRERVRALAGKVLVCFCKPHPCHGDILAACADWLATLSKKNGGHGTVEEGLETSGELEAEHSREDRKTGSWSRGSGRWSC